MTDKSNYLKKLILHGEVLEMDLCALANKYHSLLKSQKNIIEEQIKFAEKKIKELEAMASKDKELVLSNKSEGSGE